MLDYAVAFTNFAGAYPDILAINASGPATSDGTEFVANMINDSMWGVNQMILNHAGLSPNGVLESDSASQIKEALWKGFGGHPGKVNEWHLDDDPSVSGHRCLPLNGQGILRASYVELDAAVYVGDANNAAVAAGGGFYYRADDAAGTIPNIAGVWLILPETRGYTARGLDVAASVDPDGASRFLGDIQLDAFQGHFTALESTVASVSVADLIAVTGVHGGGGGTGIVSTTTGAPAGNISAELPITDGVNGAPRTDSESRTTNYSTKKVVWY